MSWFLQVFTLEARKLLQYRADFWLRYLAIVFVFVVMATFLWTSIFESRQIQELNGFTLSGMIFYYLLMSFTDRIVRGHQWLGLISTEIYEGALTRYLIYPVSFLGTKYVGHLAQAMLSIVQMGLGVALYVFVFGAPSGMNLTVQSWMLGILICVASTYLFFSLATLLEMVAFWADNVWSLSVLLRLVTMFMGGAMVPLSFFPENWRPLLEVLPFYLMLGFPVSTFCGQLGFVEIVKGFVWIFGWSTVFTALGSVIWRRGLKQYTGVGI